MDIDMEDIKDSSMDAGSMSSESEASEISKNDNQKQIDQKPKSTKDVNTQVKMKMGQLGLSSKKIGESTDMME